MLALKGHRATPEQLPIISGTRLGVEVIRGAAGSGKTSTALLRLEALTHMFRARRRRLGSCAPIRILVLTFNRTLAGYIEHLAASQINDFEDVEWDVKTFASWAATALGGPNVIPQPFAENLLRESLGGIGLDSDFLIGEIDYIRGRFRPTDRQSYIALERTGRGTVPGVPRVIRPAILQAIAEYEIKLGRRGQTDWNLMAESMLGLRSHNYDVVIVDEAQDFSANQLRAVAHHLADPSCLTLVLDTAQRLYPRGYTWSETGINMQAAVYHRLRENHRNTVEIAQFSRGIIEGISVDDDGTLPDFDAATRHGSLPIVCVGTYRQQVQFALNWIVANVDLSRETVAFLKPLGGAWFNTLVAALRDRGMSAVELTRDREWPEGPENIALSTMHSAKGLEFDHVIMLGLSGEVAPLPKDPGDEAAITRRKLVAMAAGRARSNLLIGYKNGEESAVTQYFVPGTFTKVIL